MKVYVDVLLFSCLRCFLQVLLEEGADIDAIDYEGDTPLHITARAGHLQMAKASNG